MSMDEPSLGLAPLVIGEIFNIILRLKKEGIPILLVEQNAQAAASVSEHCYVMETGYIVLHGPSQKIMRNEKIRSAFLARCKEIAL